MAPQITSLEDFRQQLAAKWPTFTAAQKAEANEMLRRLAEGDRPGFVPDYSYDPVGYFRDVLKATPTPDQEAIARATLEPPYRISVESAHNVGKSWLAAALINWKYDTFNPSCSISTAPSERDVVDILWTEVRLQRERAGLPCHFIGPRAPEMRTSDEHYAKGFTARSGESFQGRHRPNMFFVFDEAEGIEPNYWLTAKTMFQPQPGNAWLAISNPTTLQSQAYLESQSTDQDGNPTWKVFRMSAIDHPNIKAQLAGREPPIPNAVTLAQVQSWIEDMCEPISAEEKAITDFEWPPGSGRWQRPGPDAESRILGRRPSAGTYGVWSELLFNSCVRYRAELTFPMDELPQIGADMATGKGDDYWACHARWGAISLHHETANTMDPVRIFGRLKEVAGELARLVTSTWPVGRVRVRPEQIPIVLDDDGTGNAVGALLRKAEYTVVMIGAASRATRPDRYPNRRSELWFQAAEKAKKGLMALWKLDRATLARLRMQLLAPTWDVTAAGQRQVEKKDRTKERIHRSPDDADAMNLAYLSFPGAWPVSMDDLGKLAEIGKRPELSWQEQLVRMRSSAGDYGSSAARRGLYGLGGNDGERRSRAGERGLFGR